MRAEYKYLVIFLIQQAFAARLADLSTQLLGQHSQRYRGRLKKSEWSSFFQSIPLQPSPSVMIPLDIDENPNKDLDPDLENLNEYKLLGVLGDDYDHHYMSMRKPLEMSLYPDGRLFYRLDNNHKQEVKNMPTDIKALSNREVKLHDDSPALRVRFSRRIKKKLQRFLWAYSYCPVRYKWKELSVRFWPRWIRVGSCDSTRSCSIPAGMTCKPSKMRNIKILRYYCPIRGSKKNCQWIKFQYPILDKCSCSCSKGQASYYTKS